MWCGAQLRTEQVRDTRLRATTNWRSPCSPPCSCRVSTNRTVNDLSAYPRRSLRLCGGFNRFPIGLVNGFRYSKPPQSASACSKCNQIRKMKLNIKQVGKGGFPPLVSNLLIEEQRGNPPFPTCSLHVFLFP